VSETPLPTTSTNSAARHKAYAVIPTLLTLGNAVCGFGAITLTAMVGPEEIPSTIPYSRTASELFFTAAQLIFLAMVFDALDGSVARLTKQTSDFGAQLDSLCDAISFGVAPAFLMLKLMHPDQRLLETIVKVPFEYPSRVLWAIAVLFMVCALLRLARFTVDTEETDSPDYFIGLPSPAAAGVIAAFPIGLKSLKDVAADTVTPTIISLSSAILPPLTLMLPLISIAVSLLMVSRLRYPHVVNHFLRGTGNRSKLIKIVFALLLIFVIREMALPVLFCYFAFAVPSKALWNRRKKQPVRG